MQIEPLNLSHQALLEPRLRQLNIPLSEYSFACLYLFRDIHRYEVMKLQDEIFIRGMTRDQVSFIMPTIQLEKLPSSILEEALASSHILFPIPENWLVEVNTVKMQSYFMEEDNDYLFSLLKLKNYPGRHLDSKRNQINHLLSHDEVTCEKLQDQVKDVLKILAIWQEEHGDGDSDYASCLEAILQFHQLKLYGHIVYVNHIPAGFVIGELTCQDYFTVHFLKAIRSIKGLFPYLLQELAKSLEGSCSWINLEQDLGIASIRYSKLSYQPDLLMKKWRLRINLN